MKEDRKIKWKGTDKLEEESGLMEEKGSIKENKEI